MSRPKVSVCIDVYNYADYLAEAVHSVLRQDFTDYELIILDDASSDGSYAIAAQFAAGDRRILARRHAVNLGMIRNRNACLRMARGEYVKILHADDFFSTHDALGKMVALLDGHPGMSLAACALQSSPPTKPRIPFSSHQPTTGTVAIARCLRERRNLIGPPSGTIFRRDRALRGFDEEFFNSADWEMWLHLLEQGSLGFLSEPLVSYRRHSRQQTEKDKASLTEAADALHLLARYLDKPYLNFSRFTRRALRHRAQAEFLRRSRSLGLRDGREMLAAQGAAPFFFGPTGRFLSDQLCRQLSRLGRFRDARESVATLRKDLSRCPAGLNMAGFFQGEYGVGESSRAVAQAIRSSGLPTALLNISSRNHRNADRSFEGFATTNPYSVNLMTFSFDYARRFFHDAGKAFFRDRFNVGLWYWELEKFPARWHGRFDYYDEIWTATDFCQNSLQSVAPIPVVPIGYPLPIETPPPADRSGFGLDDNSYLFLFNFDFHSVVERKNPEGVIEAFRKAFGGTSEPVCLILKTINARHHTGRAQALERLADGLNIVWMNEHFDGERMKTLFATADCYISLHRSEGLGLGMARAMSFGKPVIATGYSGNLDFTTPENSLLVRYALTELPCDYGVYEKGSFWAEPDTDHAALLMRQVVENPADAVRMGQRARENLLTKMSPQSFLDRVRARLEMRDPRFASL